jgi:cytosine/adenosine deaminase-related metal-dependent hydrolase
VPGCASSSLFGWLKTLYPIWARYTPQDVYAATRLGLAELAMSGCTLSSDHLYLFPNGVTLDDTIAAAASVGLRFHPTRGSMSVGESAGGLPPDSLVEREDAILADTIRVIDRFHDASEGSMVRVGVAPCSPFSVSRELMRDAALLAREKKVMLHTHLAEDRDDVAYSSSASDAARVNMRRIWAGPGRMCGMPIACNSTPPKSRCFPPVGPGGTLPLLELPPGIGDRAGAGHGRCGRAGRAGRGWFGVQ